MFLPSLLSSALPWTYTSQSSQFKRTFSAYLTCPPPPAGRESAGLAPPGGKEVAPGLAQEGAPVAPSRSSKRETPQPSLPTGFSREPRDSPGSSSVHPGGVVERNELTFRVVMLLRKEP